jgi:pyruvate/2-oxoglutarate dehydrogenase complex dihydrolipoamide acyltransferase (E2) component
MLVFHLRHALKSVGGSRFGSIYSVHGSALLFGDISVPHMGDSISEGTIASVLKKVGDSVAMDEVIAQIETDKVTIDCKSGEAGVVQSVLVQAGAVVRPGQIVASVAPGTGGAPAPRPVSPAAAAAPPATTASSAPAHGARTPGIHFPTRRTASGERISDLPAAQQDQLFGANHGAATPQPRPATTASSLAPSAKAKVVTTMLQSAPARCGLSCLVLFTSLHLYGP